ncbi:MAG TPA: hypothetical protein VFU07_01345 [Candidatus Lumbricidophila sp.]|nr:hypothetical protein [Candidatus Lumbricidophila sp.]
MDFSGGGLLLGAAAVLWVAYLLPSWLGRRKYQVGHEHAVRLQQTLRALAETAEAPEAVVLEANAREVAAQKKVLAARAKAMKAEAETARLEAEREAAAALARQREAEAQAAAAKAAAEAAGRSLAQRAARKRRVREARLACAAVMLVSLVVGIGSTAALAFGAGDVGGLAAAPLMSIGCFVLGLGGTVVLARPGRRVASSATAVAARPTAPEFAPIEFAQSARRVAWTPRELPKPLHLSAGTVAAAAMASVDESQRLSRAAAAAKLEFAAAQRAAQIPRLPVAPVVTTPAAVTSATAGVGVVKPEASVNRYATMGIVDAVEGSALTDLTDTLRRRRQAS